MLASLIVGNQRRLFRQYNGPQGPFVRCVESDINLRPFEEIRLVFFGLKMSFVQIASSRIASRASLALPLLFASFAALPSSLYMAVSDQSNQSDAVSTNPLVKEKSIGVAFHRAGVVDKVDFSRGEAVVRWDGGSTSTFLLYSDHISGNFQNLKIGDRIAMTIARMSPSDIKKIDDTAKPQDSVLIERHDQYPPGKKPGGSIERVVHIIGRVLSIDRNAGFIALKTPWRRMSVMFAESKSVDNIEVGDMVEAKYNEGLNIEILDGNVRE